MMTDTLNINYTANCGVLIRTESTAVFIDGICEETEHFDGMDAPTFRKMMDREEPFAHLDYILFSHSHRDHFDCRRTAQYLSKHKISGLLLPKESLHEMTDLLANVRYNNIPLLAPGIDESGIRRCEMGDMMLTYFYIPHSGKEYRQVNHYAFLIEAGGQKIYLSGDSSFQDDAQTKMLNGVDVDVAFFNPYHLNSTSGRTIISEINAKENYIYHIPPEGKDDFHIRRQAVKDEQRYQNTFRNLELILQPNVPLY